MGTGATERTGKDIHTGERGKRGLFFLILLSLLTPFPRVITPPFPPSSPFSPSSIIDLVVPPLHALTLGTPEQPYPDRPGGKAGDVRPECDAASRRLPRGRGNR